MHIFPENAGKELIYDKNGDVAGIITGDKGVRKSGKRGEMFMKGMGI